MKQFYVGLAALIENKGKFLVMKRSPEKDFLPNTWETITGRLEEAESPEIGLLREVEEEAGIEIEIVMPIDTGFFYRGGKEYPMVFISFWCRYLSGDVVLDWEHTEYRWITIEEALKNDDLRPFHKMFNKIQKMKEIANATFRL